MTSDPVRIAIAGGGFSGVLVLANLVERAKSPIAIDLYDDKEQIGQGIAYGTDDTVHLLNVRADRMGAFAGKPGDLFEWLQSDAGKAASARIWPRNAITAESFVPRKLYAAYLQDILQRSLTLAAQKKIAVALHRATITDAKQSGSQLLLTVGGAEKKTNILVLATGNPPPRPFDFPAEVLSSNRYIADIWQPPEGTFPRSVSKLPMQGRCVIIGTGLTAIDAILTLSKNNYRGKIIAISRGGLLPQPHAKADAYPAWEWTKNPSAAPKSALGLLHGLRAECAKGNWRGVIDSLRPVTQPIWQQLPLGEKKKFLRRLFTFWNIHRHRMAPEIAAQLEALQKQGKLEFISGRIVDAAMAGEQIGVRYRPRGANPVAINADLLLNCTGPDWALHKTDQALLANLARRGLIGGHALGMGISPEKTGKNIFAIGPLLVGELLESVAVPELREQALTTAESVLQQIG